MIVYTYVHTYIHTFMYNCTYAKMASNYVTATVTIYIFLLQVRKSSRSCWMYGVSHPPLPPTAMKKGSHHLQVWLCLYVCIYLKNICYVIIIISWLKAGKAATAQEKAFLRLRQVALTLPSVIVEDCFRTMYLRYARTCKVGHMSRAPQKCTSM